MKSLFFVTFFLLSSQLYAYYNVRAYCEINGGVNAQCRVCNFVSYSPIYCQVNTVGTTSYGFRLNSYVQGAIMPGQCANSYIYANSPYQDPLVNAFATVQCR